MATFEEGKGWKSNTGINDYHSTEAGANERDRRFNEGMRQSSSGGGASEGIASGMSVVLPIIVGVVVVCFIVLTIIALVRMFFGSAFTLVKTYPLYLVIIVAAISAYVFVRRQKKIGGARKFLALLAAVAIGFLGWTGTKAVYINKIIRPSIYCADYIQPQPDGGAVPLYEKANNKGKVLAELIGSEKVAVNGMSNDKNSYNITTAGGVTGWVELAAFPEDAAELIWTAVGLDGFERGNRAIDRQTAAIFGKYFVRQKEKSYHILNSAAMKANTGVDAQTPLRYVMAKDYKKGAELTDEGVTVELSNILYLEDCTIVLLMASDVLEWEMRGPRRRNAGFWYLSGRINTNEWKNSLTVTDLDTGDQWKVLPANYRHLTEVNIMSGKEDGKDKVINSIAYFFPPFKSRHFSLTFEEPALPGKNKAGYGGILGAMASILPGNNTNADAYFIEYNFPEVRVK